MPGYKGHLVGGLLTFGLLRACTLPLLKAHLVNEIACLLLTLLGSLFPDVDIKSKGQKIFYSMALAVALICFANKAWNSLAWLGIMCFFPLAVVHRGPMHNPYVLIATPWLTSQALNQLFPKMQTLSPLYSAFFIAGALSHILLDFGLRKTLKKFIPWRVK